MFLIQKLTIIFKLLTVFFLTALNLYYTIGDLTGGIVNIKEFEYGDDLFFEIMYPPELQYTYRIRPAKDIGIPFRKENFPPENNKLILPDPIYGCHKPKNARAIKGKVAFVKRGDCSFLKKTLVMESCGAKAVIITDSNIYDDSAYVHMINDDII
ncbi:PRADC1-like protein isoform X2 [Daktulosphaira vitifoliae]|uniref:PRADC1-like protein isoform X2 n=1 Tax=Daktulosphaira vitifoliae TaxID=58002 RepID=UPI0021A9D42E|nr:PRADC1-like protein isoform X2 [Daktulosphaira vitifoliae]